MACTGGANRGWYLTCQVQEVVTEAGIRHGRCKRLLLRLVSYMTGKGGGLVSAMEGTGGGYGSWYQTLQVEELVIEADIRHGR
jgi:hypothetical protein